MKCITIGHGQINRADTNFSVWCSPCWYLTIDNESLKWPLTEFSWLVIWCQLFCTGKHTCRTCWWIFEIWGTFEYYDISTRNSFNVINLIVCLGTMVDLVNSWYWKVTVLKDLNGKQTPSSLPLFLAIYGCAGTSNTNFQLA